MGNRYTVPGIPLPGIPCPRNSAKAFGQRLVCNTWAPAKRMRYSHFAAIACRKLDSQE